MKYVASLVALLYCCISISQTTTIPFELNGKISDADIVSGTASENPFKQFIGEWTLKNDTWIQNWGSTTDTLIIAKHHTIASQINTENSLLQIIDGPAPNGHIYWVYNPNTKVVSHVSSFGSIRIGNGSGGFDKDGNLHLKVHFEGEVAGTYRMYTYTWISRNEYVLNSIQYDKNDTRTGKFYKGTFIRIDPASSLKKEIEGLLAVLDDNSITKEKQLTVYDEHIIHMAPNHSAIANKRDLLTYLKQQATYGHADMKHEIIDFAKHGAVIIMRGKVRGKFYPKHKEEATVFETKNQFILKRVNGELKISSVIYNNTPIGINRFKYEK
ncbi:hypothetical protein ABN763_04270 [Spongiivirga sp. MCCC 1A20706]|uniref:hypothetical protein n=1 Tax=Spongiivirga sp. MCCC 1A20706 TaxID=3160963 RepID=UPI003977A485